MRWQNIMAGAAVVVLTSISVASATNWTLSADVSTVFDSSFNVVSGGGGPYPAGHTPSSNLLVPHVAGGSIYQVNYYLSITNVNAGSRGFSNMDFSITLAGPISNTTVPGWVADGSTTDINGVAPQGNTALWSTNADGGSSTTDLQHIILNIANIPSGFNSADMRPLVGLPSGPKPYTNTLSPTPVNATGWATGADAVQNKTFIGTLFVDSTSFYQGQVTATITQASNADSTTGQGLVDPTPVFTPAVVFLGLPEPGSIVLMGLGGLGILMQFRRRHSERS